MTRTAYLVAHTHWDREWYRTFQQFRLDLVRTIDQVLDTLDADPAFTHFLLDGQTIVIDDYLAMRPERAGDLRRHIENGRIAVGPWYCHPDLFLVSGESIVRNLMLGQRMARDWGRSLEVGYIPDQFGHTGQLPQILRGVGIDSAVLWRGVDARAVRNESWWEAPDGSRVLLVLLAQSYNNAQALPLEPAALARRLRQLGDLLVRGATGPAVLLMNGGDHQQVQSGLPAALARANELLAPDWHVEQTDLQQAVTRLRAGGAPEGVLRGELRSPATAHLLPGVLSARIPLKQRNVLAQLLLEREAEPYAAWAASLGTAYPLGELWEAWRTLLQNQPHDSICGCSIDQVHREMGTRFDAVEQIGGELIGRSLAAIAAHVDTRPPPGAPPHTVPLLIFNPGPGPRSERVRLSLQLPGVAAGYALLDAQGQHVPHRWLGLGGEPSTVMPVPRESIPSAEVVLAQFEGNRIMGMGVQDAATTLDDSGLHISITIGESGVMSREEIEEHAARVEALLHETAPAPVTLHVHRNARLELELLAHDVPAYGYTTLWLQPTDADTLDAAGLASMPGDMIATDATSRGNGNATDSGEGSANGEASHIENEFFAVDADAATGALYLTDRRSGARYGPCNVFVDSGDAGDSYTFAAPPSDRVVDMPLAPPTIAAQRDELGACLTIAQQLNVPVGLSEDRSGRSDELTAITIESTVTLTAFSPHVDITTVVDNTACDHRLRVRFSAPFSLDHVHAEGAFEVVRRPIAAAAMEGSALEDPVPDAPQHGFILLHGRDRGLAIASVGLPEYEAAASGDTVNLGLTLLRCVGWLSRDDLPTRRGGAGPTVPVPDAQCLGRHVFTYRLIPYVGDWRDAIEDAHRAQVPPRALPVTPGEGTLPPSASFLRIDAPGVLVSAIKGAEDRRGIVVRLFNVGATPTEGTMQLLRAVSRVERLTLDERPAGVMHDGDPTDTIPLNLPPHHIETLRIEM